MTAPFQLFPALDAATESALRAGIERFGVLVPIAVDQHGNVLDGHHRRRIANELGRDYQTNHHVVADEDEAREIARMLNADRRQLTATQRKDMVEHLRSLGHSVRAIAEAVGAGVGTVHNDLSTVQDRTVETVVGKDGKRRKARMPTVASKNKREADTVQQVMEVAAEVIPESVVDSRRAERLAREAVADQRRAEPIEPLEVDDVEIRHGDLRTMLDDLAGTVDAIITDPPYVAAAWRFDDDSVYVALGEVARHVLKPNGVLAVMIGTRLEMLDNVDAQIGRYMRRRHRGVYLVPGPRWRDQQERVATGYKPILIYAHPDATDLAWINDDVFASSGDDKGHHHWGQSETGMASLIERLTAPGQLVVDPFLGGGTTAVVCRDLGRRFIGCDVDAAAIHATQERLSG